MAELEIDSRAFDAALLAAATGESVEVAVVTNDSKARDYWGVLESGSAPGRRPWPTARKKTVRGEGGRIFSRQARRGWVRRYGNTFLGYLTQEYLAVSTNPTALLPGHDQLKGAANRAARRMLQFLRGTVPVDTGRLRDSLDVRELK